MSETVTEALLQISIEDMEAMICCILDEIDEKEVRIDWLRKEINKKKDEIYKL